MAAAHLSEKNNTPALAQAALEPVLGDAWPVLRIADPKLGLDWLSLG